MIKYGKICNSWLGNWMIWINGSKIVIFDIWKKVR